MADADFRPVVAIVDFHHLRGPEVEQWIGLPEGAPDPAEENDWTVLPFLALPDGAHALDEELSYFTLRRKQPQGSLFGISCTRSVDASTLANKHKDVTRSAVQKAIVAILDSPHLFARIREKLSAVTKAWFAQRDFTEVEIIQSFYEDLAATCARAGTSRLTPVSSPLTDGPAAGVWPTPGEPLSEPGSGAATPRTPSVSAAATATATRTKRDHEFVGLSLRQIVHSWKAQTLVLFKAILLQPRILFFSTNCETLCLLQFALVSLIPGLINNLDDCADPTYNSYAESGLKIPEHLQTSSRESLLRYMGLPLQLFGKGALFGPYTPLQLLDVLEDAGTSSYICGSTNALVIRQREIASAAEHQPARGLGLVLPRFASHAGRATPPEHAARDDDAAAAAATTAPPKPSPPRSKGPDILVNLDDLTMDICPSLRAALALTPADKRFIDLITLSVESTWDPANPSRPNTLAYPGSEEFIRLQFEEYLLALLSAASLASYTASHPTAPRPSLDASVTSADASTAGATARDKDPITPFNQAFYTAWRDTHAFATWSSATARAALFDIVPPLHPCAGTTSTSLALEDIQRRIADLKLETRFQNVGASFVAGRERVGAALVGLWSEAAGERRAAAPSLPAAAPAPVPAAAAADADEREKEKENPEHWDRARESVSLASQRASAYFNSWGTWAAEKRKQGWRGPTRDDGGAAAATTPPPRGLEASVSDASEGSVVFVSGHGSEGGEKRDEHGHEHDEEQARGGDAGPEDGMETVSLGAKARRAAEQ